MTDPQFMVLEGIDGSGKSTLSKRLRDRIEQTVGTFEPRDDMLTGFLVRQSIQREDSDPLVDFLLYVADHIHHLDTVVNPALESGSHVISDRYYHSRYVYQPLDVTSPDRFTRLLSQVGDDISSLSRDVEQELNTDTSGRLKPGSLSTDHTKLLSDALLTLTVSASPMVAGLVRAALCIDATGGYIPLNSELSGTQLSSETTQEAIIELHTLIGTNIPDRTFILDVSPQIALSRTSDEDKFSNISFLEGVRGKYLELENTLDEDITVINAERSQQEICDTVLSQLDFL